MHPTLFSARSSRRDTMLASFLSVAAQASAAREGGGACGLKKPV